METAAYKLAELKAMLKDGQTDIPALLQAKTPACPYKEKPPPLCAAKCGKKKNGNGCFLCIPTKPDFIMKTSITWPALTKRGGDPSQDRL